MPNEDRKPIASTYEEWRKQKCEWCASPLPINGDGKHYKHGYELGGTSQFPLDAETFPCTSGDRDAYEGELVARLTKAEKDTERLDWLQNEHPAITWKVVQTMGYFLTWTVAPVWKREHTREDLRVAIDAARKGDKP